MQSKVVCVGHLEDALFLAIKQLANGGEYIVAGIIEYTQDMESRVRGALKAFFDVHCWAGLRIYLVRKRKSCKKLKFVEAKFDWRIESEVGTFDV